MASWSEGLYYDDKTIDNLYYGTGNTTSWYEYKQEWDIPDCSNDVMINDMPVKKSIKKLQKEVKKLKEDENMRYLYEVILVNPKNDEFFVTKVVAKTDTSAYMLAHGKSDLSVPFDELKTECRILMEWKKEKSLTKAIETIKKAVE